MRQIKSIYISLLVIFLSFNAYSQYGIIEMKNGEEHDFHLRIRYRQKLQKARLFKEKAGMYIVFEEEQKSITPGQFAAWYLDKELIGSGVIA